MNEVTWIVIGGIAMVVTGLVVFARPIVEYFSGFDSEEENARK